MAGPSSERSWATFPMAWTYLSVSGAGVPRAELRGKTICATLARWVVTREKAVISGKEREKQQKHHGEHRGHAPKDEQSAGPRPSSRGCCCHDKTTAPRGQRETL